MPSGEEKALTPFGHISARRNDLLLPAIEQVHAWLARGAAPWTVAELRAFAESAIERTRPAATRPA